MQGHLESGLSLERIGRLEGKHPSTVSYWVAKHGLIANGRARHQPNGRVEPERFRAMVEAGATIREIAAKIGISYSATRHWLAALGLETHRMAGRDRFSEARRLDLRQIEVECPNHGLTRHVRRSDGVYRCARCSSESVARRRRKVKRMLVAEAGGACLLCGYDRCIGALQFHHLDPSKKEFAVSLRGVTPSIEALRREAAKCVLLCANCHAEVENGLAEVPRPS